MSQTIRIRPATGGDERFILDLARRFADCDLPAWRSPDEVEEGTRRWLEQALRSPADGACIAVAEAGDATPLGFVLVHERHDFFTGEPYGHISDVAVVTEAEGTGAAEALMRAAAEWARGRGYTRIGLNVFAGNARARRFYERLGYSPETLAYSKSLSD